MSQDTLYQGSEGEGAPGESRDERDAVDAIVGQWMIERPDLDPSAKQVAGRIVRLASLFQQAYADGFAPLGVNDSDYGVLAALRRSGGTFELTPTELAKQRMMTSGGMTAAIDRLERRGLILREPNPSDRRGSLVRLTPDGRTVIDEAMTVHVDVERRLVGVLDMDEQEQLATLLRRLLLGVDTA